MAMNRWILAIAILAVLGISNPLHGADELQWVVELAVENINGLDELPTGIGIGISGAFMGLVDFDPGPDTTSLQSQGDDDWYAATFDSLGNLVWALGFGTTSEDVSLGMAVDSAGKIYVSGACSGAGHVARLGEAGFEWGAGFLPTQMTNGFIFVTEVVLDSLGNL